ncbi:YkvA family protein [Oscillatoria sp. CS-180]|uniref:YkvA family protein n=1 Tax=Oscillatoria sp. CS-180 TaxID=3021720 RepID=UPI00233127E5|nr:YkvA family protein [Oscillatoria sp. CS-180]MDB9525780.1 YkvA family protein [Oscillatoria sp. CS-180]
MDNFVQSFYNWYKATMRHPKYRWYLIGGTLLYLISPIDIAPEFIPIIGWIDDAAIATLLFAEISQLFLERINKRDENVENNAATPNNIDVAVIDVE